jgi:hypothetical protein
MNSGQKATGLNQLKLGGSTARVLDLYSITRERGETEPDIHARPFFRNLALNRGFFVKHTLRPHERDLVDTANPVVTKIILPISEDDLSIGAHSIFVEEVGFEKKLASFLACDVKTEHMRDDLERIHQLAQLPSFDPFLLAVQFSQCDRPVSPVYFQISTDQRREMEEYVARKIGAVVSRAFAESSSRDNARRSRIFANLLLSGEDNERLAFLQTALGLTPEEFESGIFGWKGLLFYQWSLHNAQDSLKKFLEEFGSVVIMGATADERRYLDSMRRKIMEETGARWRMLSQIITEFDEQFVEFHRTNRPTILKDFLLRAPSLFYDLGTDLSAVNHVTSYWFYRLRNSDRQAISMQDANDLFPDFLASVVRADQEFQDRRSA